MRPLRLALRGFTSFREPQEIDLSSLEVFAIAGPTGAGKSSLLDAMTYALYGEVERVGVQCGQLVSQGLSRMAVTLDFRVGRDDYRIARSTPVSGPSRVILERLVDGKAESYGEGADRVREVRELIRKIVGLDYDGFTRSVILPQGKFSEFLTGDGRKRREILSDLLGLDLFDRMAKRANQIGRDSKFQGEAKQAVVEREYAGVTQGSLDAALAAASSAIEMEKSLAAAAVRVASIAGEWETTQAMVRQLASCEHDANALADVAEAASARLQQLEEDVRRADAEVANRKVATVRAASALAKASAARQRAEAKWGRVTELAALRVRAEALPKLERAATAATQELNELRAALPKISRQIDEASKALAATATAETVAERELAAAKHRLELAEHANKVGALVSGLKKGDPCPICGERLKVIPKAAGEELAASRKGLKAAEATKSRATETVMAARLALQGLRKDLDALKRDLKRSEDAAESVTAELTKSHQTMAAAFAGKRPADPVKALTERIEGIEAAAAEERAADVVAQGAERSLNESVQVRTSLDSALSREGTRLEVNTSGLLERLLALGFAKTGIPKLGRPPSMDTDLEATVAWGVDTAAKLRDLRERIRARVSECEDRGPALLAQALTVTHGLIPPARDLATMHRSVTAAATQALQASALAQQAAKSLAERLSNRAVLESEVAELTRRAQLFSALALELRADRIIAFLQAEALQVMALAATVHLARLSDDRYALVCREDDEFFVIDKWNGDEERSVRTLSGGETFLASLSLALGLAEQVQSLSVTERARLDSLFLDEGFGGLDAETLRTAIDAIHQLAGGGRLVGVITHVRDLTDQFVRLEVSRTPQGSTVKLVA